MWTLNYEKLSDALTASVKELYSHDKELIQICANERLLAHWVAINFSKQSYIHSIISSQKEYIINVDIEYNRFGDIPNTSKQSPKGSACSVDMVFHSRKNQECNILCIEIKSPKFMRLNEKCRNDVTRVRRFTLKPKNQSIHRPKYEYGAFVHIVDTHSFDIVFCNSGKLISATTYSFDRDWNTQELIGY